LSRDIRPKVDSWEPARDDEADGDRWIQMAAGDVPDGVRHRENGEAEGQGNTCEANSELWKRSG
jgi:hypothetical protein